MDSNMSAAAFMHRSNGSSDGVSSPSADGGRGPSATSGPGTGGGRMAVIGVTRSVKLRRRGNAGFGFSLRGGREYAAGFYVSDVQPGGEADKNGLRVGDQIIRVNGYPVEDAVHQEVALLAKNQQVLVLKIRSVGMIPVKDNPNDPVTWHMVQQQQQHHHSHQPPPPPLPPLEYNEVGLGVIPSSEIRIRILVGEKGRLGCGVCRGVVPGLTVQGTREGGAARAAGLKAGDVITWCNGQRLTDLPFERAIEVMRGSPILDVIVQRPMTNHLYDCPEPLWARSSSGYDSETSSLAVEGPPVQPHHHNTVSSPYRHRSNDPTQPHHQRYPSTGDMCNRNDRICCPTQGSACSYPEQGTEWKRKSNNTTVIRVNQNQNLRGHHPTTRLNSYDGFDDDIGDEPLYDPVAPRVDYEVHDFDANPRDEANRRLAFRRDHCVRQQDIVCDSPANDLQTFVGLKNGNRSMETQPIRKQETERKTVTTVEVHQSGCPPAPPPLLPCKWPSESKPMNAMGMQMGSTISMGSTGSTETESSLESCCKDSTSTSSSLSTSSCEPLPTVTLGTTNSTVNSKPIESSIVPSIPKPPPLAPLPPTTDLGTAIAQELQRRAQQKNLNSAKTDGTMERTETRKFTENIRSQDQKVAHDKLMEEFKLAHRRMFNNTQQKVVEENLQKDQQKRASNGVLSSPSSSNKKNLDDSVDMQSIESFKLKNSPSSVPKPPATYFSMNENTDSKSQMDTIKRDTAVSNELGTRTSSVTTLSTNNEKSTTTPGHKVAVIIGTYEGDCKQPSRLDFLVQQSRNAEEKSTTSPNETTDGAPVVSRLQNELVATLQRSNLRRKTDGDDTEKRMNSETIKESGQSSRSNVEKLATVLSNKVTIKVNPDSGSR